MKRFIGIILLGIVITFSCQQLQAQKYGYINKDEIFKAMPEYDTVTVLVDNLRKEFENQLAAMQSELSAKTTSLNNESNNLSDFLRKGRQDELNRLNVRLQLFQVKADQQLQDKGDQLLKPVLEKVDNAIKDVAKEEGFIFILDGAQLIYSDEKKCTNLLPLVKAKLGLK
jgi:outer membrane protein